MPQINRIRVNNVKYNFGTQYYDDFLMRFSCRNALYDLANGGGKSVLMLLLLQNLIPNCTLDDKQPVEKLFRAGGDNTVIHSLIEWKLDDCDIRSGYRYMLTGFCARKAREAAEDNERGAETASIEYFNYCIFYKEFGENDIKNLPLSNGGERITYSGLRSYLKELEKRDYGVEVRIFDRKGDYQNFISGYGLHESQWEIIRGINRTEGHVRTYFESSYRTTRKVIEDLLIEGIIEKSYNNRIRKGEEDDSQMAKTLLDIKEKLIELAKRREDINSYDGQIALLDAFAERIMGFKSIYSDKKEAEDSLIKYLLICRSKLEGEKKKISGIQERINVLEARKTEVLRLRAAAEIEAETAELEKTDSLIEETLGKKEVLCSEKRRIDTELRYLKAAEDYYDYLENKKKYDELKELIKSSSMNTSDALEKMKRLAATKYMHVESRKERLASVQEECRLKSEALKAALDEAETEKLNIYGLMNKNEALVEELKNETDALNRSLDLLMSECGIIAAVDLEEKLDEIQEEIKAFRENAVSVKGLLETEREKYSDFKQRITENDAKLSLTGEEIDRCTKTLEKDRELYERLDSIKRIYAENDPENLAVKMGGMLKSLNSEIVRNQDGLNEIRKTEMCIREKRLPEYDKQFDVFYNYVSKRYPDVKSGSEIIAGMNEQDKNNILKNFPQAVYSVFADESYEDIKKDPSVHKLMTGSFIIPVFRKNVLEEGVNPYEEITAAYRDMAYIFDAASAKAELDRLNDEAEKLEEKQKRLGDKHEVIEKDIFDLRYILSELNSGIKEDTLKNLKTDYEKLNDKKQEYIESLEIIRERISSYEKTLDEESQKLEGLNGIERSIRNIKDKNILLNEKYKKLKEYEAEYKLNNREYKNLVKKSAQLSLEYGDNEKQFKAAADEFNAVRKDFDTGYKMYFDGNTEGYSDMSEEETDARAGALRKLLAGEMGETADKERLLLTYESAMNKAVDSLRYNEMSLKEAEEARAGGMLVKASLEERMKLKEGLVQTEERIRKLEETVSSEQAHKNRIEGSIWHEKKIYEEKFGEYQAENITNPQSFIISAGHEIAQINADVIAAGKELKAVEEADRELLIMEKDITRIIKNAGLSIDDSITLSKEDDSESFSAEEYENVQKRYEQICREEAKRKNVFTEDKQKLEDSLIALKAYELAGEIKRSISVPSDVGDVDRIIQGIKETNECIRLEKDNIERGIKDMQRIKDSFEERCVQICSNIRAELDRLPKMSKITLDDEQVPMLTLSIPYIKEEFYRERMSVYINEVVSCAETFASQDEKFRYIKGQLSWKKLFSVIVTDMNSIKLCLYKREHIKSQSRYLKYEEAVGSTGQSQGIYIQFLIAVIHYISNINSAGKDAGAIGKTIFIDNPFGAAKDVYIWEPIFKLLKTNHVQMIVPARGATPAITGMFDVNYILGQKMVGDRQQTVVVDYRSQTDTEKMDYSIVEFEQTALNLD